MQIVTVVYECDQCGKRAEALPDPHGHIGTAWGLPWGWCSIHYVTTGYLDVTGNVGEMSFYTQNPWSSGGYTDESRHFCCVHCQAEWLKEHEHETCLPNKS
jgi:hypothetical protein